MVGKNNVGPFTHKKPASNRNPAFGKHSDFIKKSFQIKNNAVTEHTFSSRVKNAGWNVMQDKFLGSDIDGVTRVVPALKSDDVMTRSGQQVDHFPFSFVAPLSTN